ncbi:DMT family transporter [Agromyces aerolatus]|uniref:DMT family transporter n=1 Tax=Agromyces sp. LY-1074 TaxID=3074080 RepID=UPI00285E1320|nr:MULTISPECIES: DMT family transporter [unclassified Agromyces]MDR5700214.1 DMT family transporter [Agromyces sp. LY-1074]MDR5706418.1 DMT family transporter [Agromyces sp. LY-1358]
MNPDLSDLTEQIALDPVQFIGIPLALVGAVFLSLGAQFQHRGVVKVESRTVDSFGKGLNGQQLMLLLARPSWVLGTLMLGLAIAFQLSSLYFAPIIVVQPLGAIALVLTSIVNSRVAHVKLNHKAITAIAMCVGGVFLFVGVAAFTAVDQPVTDQHLITILIILAVVLAAAGAAFVIFRDRLRAIFYVIMAGVIYGFVATLAKVILGRLQQREFEWLTLLCLIALLLATALGAYFVQNAHASGPPDLVIAGLTVVDPIVAVTIGIVVLGEASQAPLWAIGVFVLAGIIAVWGVFQLARNHPQTRV